MAMAKTVVGSFNSYTQAQRVVDQLVDSGVARDDVSIVANNANGTPAEGSDDSTAASATTGAVTGGAVGGAAGLIAGLAGLAVPGIGPVIAAGPLVAATHAGVPREEAGYYAEAVRRGGALVTVRAEDDMAERVADILQRNDAIDIQRQAETWRTRGWTGFDENAQPLNHEDIHRERGAVLPVVEEQLRVGKREVERGGERVYSRMTEPPVEQAVPLREAHAHVERRAVDRPATEQDLATFKEGTLEVRERAE